MPNLEAPGLMISEKIFKDLLFFPVLLQQQEDFLKEPNSLLSRLTIVKTVDCDEGGLNHLAMTIINPREKIWPSRESNQRPPVSKSCTLLTELWCLAIHFQKNKVSNRYPLKWSYSFYCSRNLIYL